MIVMNRARNISWMTLLEIVAYISCADRSAADDWRQFRGNDSSGVSNESALPTELDESDALEWKVPLTGRGISGPIVVGDRVVVTASDGYRDDDLYVLCFSTSTGEQLWQRQFE